MVGPRRWEKNYTNKNKNTETKKENINAPLSFPGFASSPCIGRIIWNKAKLVLLIWKEQLFFKDLDEKSV